MEGSREIKTAHFSRRNLWVPHHDEQARYIIVLSRVPRIAVPVGTSLVNFGTFDVNLIELFLQRERRDHTRRMGTSPIYRTKTEGIVVLIIENDFSYDS